jgi:hypothetical protein
MIDTKNKLIQISPIDPQTKLQLRLDTAFGRDTIAERIKKEIDEYSLQAYDDGPRTHLGISKIGHSCDRYLWFHFRWMMREQLSARMLRLVSRGHFEEQKFIEYFTKLGYNIVTMDEHGKQYKVKAIEGHFGGSNDAAGILPERFGIQERLLYEFKTANKKWFATISGSGVQKAKPMHYIQMCTYGYMFGLRYGLYIVVNKDDDDLHIEILELDWTQAAYNISRAERIIRSFSPPPRISESASYYECKFCEMNGICHLNEPVLKNCRSCRFAEPAANTEWFCHRYGQTIPKSFIPNGCNLHESLPH